MSQDPNVSVGFTGDGFIFLLINSVHNGEPTQTQVVMNTNGALSVADAIKQAVEGIRSKEDGGNGKDLIDKALKAIGVIAPGETPTADEEQDALKSLQMMLRHWSAKNIRVHFITEANFTPTGAESYTIGPTGVWVTAARPVTITRAYIKDSVGNQTNINFAYNPALTNGIIYVSKWITDIIYLEFLVELLEPALITANVILPDEYQEAIVYGLAVRLAPEYGRETSQTIVSLAIGGLNDLEIRNFAERIQPVDVDVIKLTKQYDINSCD